MTNPESPFKKTALKGMRALVCGASRGIGRAAVKAFADAGASVVACSRNEEALNQLVESLPGTGHQAVAMDLEKLEVVEMLINKILEDGPIHILINNAAGPPGGPLLENEVEDFEAPFKRHLHAAHTITRMLAPEMEKAGMGRIVNIISTSVKEPIPNIGLSNTLRGAMAAWSKTLSREIAPCITINNILPGFTNTDRLGSLADSIHQKTGKSIADIHDNWISQVPIERLIQPEETADAILFLCLPGSGGIRGVSLAVDGGRLRSI
jgi:3-oxoacyl-[acyl-carrier protein] reductase|tara:strand:- start:1468 stop:2265 length:798 start_codon:yes stop_codon:yes gene_type:complete